MDRAHLDGGEYAPGGIAATWLTLLAAALVVLVHAVPLAFAQSVPVQYFYVSVPEEEFRTYANAQTASVENDVQRSIISATATFDGTVVYFDQWEDGYEYDVTAPSQSTTLVWGDNNVANGIPPGFASDVINAGDVITLQSDVPVNVNGLGVRDQGDQYFDGRDKIAATQQLVVTHAMWPVGAPGTIGAQLAGAVEIFEVARWGTSYDIPVGTNVGRPGFNWVALSIMSQKDGTVVQVDKDANGTYEISQTVNEGRTLFVTTPVLRGARVLASEVVQVNLLTAESGTNYNGRLYPLLPTSTWGTYYLSPVHYTEDAPGPVDPTTCEIVLFNPGGADITVTATTLNGSTNVTVPLRETAIFAMPSAGTTQTGGRFTSASPFYAIAAIDMDNNVHNWGFTLVPRESLTTSVVAGWAPGTTNLARDASPVWVTPDAATTLYVDFDGDPATGTFFEPTYNTGYDVSYAMNALESRRIYDDVAPSDHTGYRIYTVDNVKLAAAWGQDGTRSSSGQATEFDLGTTIIPYPTLTAYKSAALVGDFNGNGGIDPGEVLRYTIRVHNSGIVPLSNIQLTDVLDAARVTYVANTTALDGAPIADDAVPPAATRFPFDEAGYALVTSGTLAPGQDLTLTFQVTINLAATGTIVNQARATSVSEIYLNVVSSIVQPGNLQITKTSSAPLLGRDLRAGDVVDYTITVLNTGTAPQTGITLTDPLPAGSTWTAGSTTVDGWREKLVLDLFDALTYANNDGPEDWAANWTETDAAGGAQSPTAGNVQAVNGELRLTTLNSAAQRALDLAGFAGGLAVLSFNWRISPFVDNAGDTVQIQVSATGGAPWTTLGSVTGTAGPSSGSLRYDISGFISASTAIRFLVSAGYGANEYFYADRVQVQSTGTSAQATDTFQAGQFYNGGAGWATNWTESENNGANTDRISIQSNAGDWELRLLRTNTTVTANTIQRSVNLSQAVAGAYLSLPWRIGGTAWGAGEGVAVEMAAAAGGPFTQVAFIPANVAGASGTISADVAAYRAAATTLRLRIVAGTDSNRYVYVDDVAIRWGTHLAVTKDTNTLNGVPDLLIAGSGEARVQDGDGFALAPGEQMTMTYRVTVNTPPNVTRLVNTVSTTSFEKAPRASATTVDPISPGGAIGDNVWLDADADGVYDVGEQGLVNARVWLDTNGNGSFDPGVDQETLTSVRGAYLFDGLPPGAYRTYIDAATVPAGLDLTAGTSGALRTITAANEFFEDVDFGYTPTPGTAVVGNLVWSDADADGAQDPGEVGIGGVEMALSAANGADGQRCTSDDTLIAFRTSGLDGTYLFTSLAPGTYVVCADVGPNHVPGDGDGILGAYTPTNGPQSVGKFYSPPTTVVADEIRTDVDFGFNNPALKSITDRVWFDVDNDGVADPGEPGIAGVTVNLFATGLVNGGGVSDANGYFAFAGLPNGNFTITIEDVEGKLIGFSGTTAAAQSGTLAVALAGADVSGVHFGYNAPGSIGDTLWSDDDQDGFHDAGESGIPGVQVRLYADTNGNGLLDVGTDALTDTTTTDAAGRYLFTVSTAGRYFVSVPPQSGAGQPLEGFTLTTSDEDPAAGDQLRIDLFTLLTSELTADFGYHNPNYHDISGTVFEDGDGDGTWDAPGEGGVSGVTLALYDGSGDLIATTTAAANGAYSFPGLRDGTYTVRVTDTNGVLDDWDQTAPALPAPPARTVVLAGADSAGNDFGFRKQPTLIVLSSFGAVATPEGVLVTWSTTAEFGVAGYLLRRVAGGREVPVSDRIVPAIIETTSGGRYSLLDREAAGAPLTYRLVEVRRAGAPVTHGPFTVTPRMREGRAAGIAPDAPYGRAARHPRLAPAAGAEIRTAAVEAAVAVPAAAGSKVRLSVTADGVYRVRAGEIAPLLGIDLDAARRLIAAQRLALTSEGRRIAYQPLGGGAGLLFYGRGRDTTFTGENVYWLGRGPGLPLRSVDAAPRTPPAGDRSFVDQIHVEEERWADTASASDPLSDYWLWDYLVAGDPLPENRIKTFRLPSPAPAPAGEAVLTVHLRGGTDDAPDPDHHVRVRVNGHAVGEATWSGLSALDLDCAFDQALLLGAGNSVEIEALLDTGAAYSLVFVDSFDLRYRRAFRAENDRLLLRADSGGTVAVTGFSGPDVAVFDVSDPRRPRRLTGTKVRGGGATWSVAFRPATPATPYLAVGPNAVGPVAGRAAWSSTGLADAANAADYLILTDAALAAAAAPLAAHRAGQGLTPKIVTVQAVMDEFNAGIRDPMAIRRFLTHALATWSVPPRYLVLAGNGSYDYRNRLGGGDSLVPSMLVPTPYGLFPSDSWFADVDSDRVPEIAVGRLPVRTPAGLSALIAKLVDAEAADGAWRLAALVAADQPDDGGDFRADASLLLDLIPAQFTKTADFLDVPGNPLANARALFTSTVTGGVSLAAYVGHAGFDALADEGLVRSSVEAAALANDGKLPLFALLTCLVGDFAEPGVMTLGELLLLRDGGGAAAVLAPTGLALNDRSVRLAREFLTLRYAEDRPRVGDVLLGALEAYAAGGGADSTTDVYVVLGDPAQLLP